MSSLLETDRRPFVDAPVERDRPSRRTRSVVALAAGAVFAAALGYLIADQIRSYDHYDQAHTSLDLTRQQTQTVAAELREVHRDLTILKRQVGSDTTALSQDSSQLLGAQTSLAAAQAHVTQQATLIGSLQTCLVGVEQALNQLAIGRQLNAIGALNAVSSACTAAEESSG